MRRALIVSLVFGASLVAVPAGAQTPACNGRAATAVGDVVYGTDGDDVLVGTAGPDRIYAGAGNDTICTLDGDDSIEPGLGDDFVDGGGGSDWLQLSVYNDTPTTVDLARGASVGGEGADELVTGSIENVVMNCSAGNADTLIGDDDDNTLSGGSGDDRIEGGGGNDLIYGTDPSVDRTDAICWGFYDDRDILGGGPGDDVVLGQVGDDDLDGGDGWDVLDGGDATDDCSNGERYARCETVNPPAPPPHCSDGADNDGDGLVDAVDPECSHLGDPREDVADDPGCNDGIDNDGDGVVDFPGDTGCLSLADETELDGCLGPCPPATLSIGYRPALRAFQGRLSDVVAACRTDRVVTIRKVVPGPDRRIGRDRTDDRGRWRVEGNGPRRGRFYALARTTNVSLPGGEVARCSRVRSLTLRIQT